MPAIRDWTFAYQSSTAATTIVGTLPSYQQNDLLLAILSADTGTTQAWSSAGWTQLFSISSTSNLAVMWKIAGASETDPTFTYSIAETTNLHLLAIRDVNTAAPFNGTGGAGTGYRTGTLATATGVFPALTTTINNSLVLFGMCESGAVVPTIHQGPVTFEDGADGTAHSDGFGWTFMPTAGLIPATVKYAKNGTAAGVQVTIGISPPSGGAAVIPPFCAGDASIFIDPMHGVTAYNGNTAFAATATTSFGTSLNGKTLANGTIAAAADVGINSFHSMGRVTGTVTAGTWYGGRLALAAGNTPNVSGKNIIAHVMPLSPKVYQNTDPLSKTGVKGVAFGISSLANTNYRVWHVHGAGTPWDTAQHVPIVVNDMNTAGRIQNTGTLDPASIESFGFMISGFLVAPAFQFGSLWALDTTTVAGGNAAEPVGVAGINKICSSGKERMSVLQQGASQILVMQPIQIGDGGTNPVYLRLDATAIEFPKQYDVSSKQVFYCGADNVAGLTYYAGASDTIKHINSVVSSLSPFHWRIHASSSASASYDFSGLAVIGAGDVTLRAVATFYGMTFTSCPVITQNSAVIDNSAFSYSKITSATLGDMDNISNCSFASSGTGHAIEVGGTASTITFTGNTFTGYAATNGSTGNEAIYVNIATGTVTINISGGGTPSIRTAGATVVVNNSVSLTISAPVTLVGAEIRIYDLDNSPAGSLGTELAGVESHDAATYVYSGAASNSIWIQIMKSGYEEFGQQITMPTANGSFYALLSADINA